MREKRTGITEAFKQGLRLMRYSTNFKTNVICSAIFTFVGVIMAIIDMTQAYYVGVYFVLGPLLAAQMIYVLNLSDMVASSPLSKKIQLDFPVFVNTILTLGGYTLLLIIAVAAGLLEGRGFENVVRSGSDRFVALFFMAMIGLFYLVYYSFAYKYMTASTIVFLIFYVLLFWLSGTDVFYHMTDNMPVPVVVITGYGLIIAGGILCYIFSKMVYRKGFSKRMFKLIAQEMK